MLLWMTLTSSAFGVDPDVAAEPLSQRVTAGQWVQADVDSWLIPAPAAEACLSLDAELAVTEQGLADCLETGRQELGAARVALEVCQGRLATDGLELARCQGAEGTLLLDVARLKAQRNTWRFVGVGVVVVGAGAAALATQL